MKRRLQAGAYVILSFDEPRPYPRDERSPTVAKAVVERDDHTQSTGEILGVQRLRTDQDLMKLKPLALFW